MGFKTDIEIAQETVMEPITEIAKTAGVDEKYLEQYGKYKAKVDYKILKDMADKPNGKLILVTAEGGMAGTYLRTVGTAGQAKLTISCDQTEPVTILFQVNKR